MNLDQFAFVNQQLAGMLKSGIPLEGALRQMCQTMHAGSLRTELSQLEADLARGTPFREAIARRQLPDFYARMMEIGAQSTDLPSLLTLLADYYQRLHLTWVRLQGLMFYPLAVLTAAFGVSLLIAILFGSFTREIIDAYDASGSRLAVIHAGLWIPVALLAVITVVVAVILATPRWREAVRWRLPGFREARLSHLASSAALLLQNGSSAAHTFELIERLEAGSPAAIDLAQWRRRLAEGRTRFEDLAEGGRTVPPLFVWLVAASRENWVEGFRHAADVYYERAVQRAELLLYAALPMSIIALGALILCQFIPMIQTFGNLGRHLVTFGAE